eukprot:c5375_g1_i1.p1 GENE.c5375_g1_i1~~c5375_g1_i1.p1  ORF type:complete len:870 (-),score=269.80 c5375_g1_i1:166-2775(-)
MIKALSKRLSQTGMKRTPDHPTPLESQPEQPDAQKDSEKDAQKQMTSQSKTKSFMKSTSKFFGQIKDGIAAGLSRQQVEDYRKAFDHFDADGSGDLSIHEIKSVLQTQGMTMTTEEVDQLVHDIDADGNGTIDFPEFLAAMARRAASKAHIGRLQNTVERVITLQKLTLPTFLPLQSSDPRYEIAEAQRQRAVDKMILEHSAQQEEKIKKTTSSAKLVQSKSRIKLDSRAQGKSIKSLLSRSFKELVPTLPASDDNPDDHVAVKQGDNVSVSEALQLTPVTPDSDSAHVETYAAFDTHNVHLYCPTVALLVSDIPQVFCVRVLTSTRYVAVVDQNFQPIKSLIRQSEHSDDELATFYGIVTVPGSCSKCFICSRGHVDERVKFEVYCHYDVVGIIEYSAKNTSREASREAMIQALANKKFKSAIHHAQVILFQDVQNTDALECEMISHHLLSHHKLAVETADTILAQPSTLLPATHPIRQKAFEIRAVSSYLRGFPQQCHNTCTAGLVNFGDSSILKQYVLRSEESRTTSTLRRSSMGGTSTTTALGGAGTEWAWHDQDTHALQTPFAMSASVPQLASHLATPFAKEVDKVRAFFRWICENIEYDGDGLRYGTYAESDFSPEGVISTGKAVCQGYVNLLKAMCDAVQCCECVVLLGYAKSGFLDIGDMQVPNHAWNALKIDDAWYLVDVTWAAGSLQADFSFRKEFNNYFWLTPPDQFILSHFPERSAFQLLNQIPSTAGGEPVCEGDPMAKGDFANALALSSHVFETGLEMASHRTAMIAVASGDSATILIHETKPDPLFLFAQIKTLDGSKVLTWDVEDEYSAAEKIHRLVVDTSGEEMGSYELGIFYSDEESGMYTALVEYRLDVV